MKSLKLRGPHKKLLAFMLNHSSVWLQSGKKNLTFGRHKRLDIPAAGMQESMVSNLENQGLIELISGRTRTEAGVYQLTALGRSKAQTFPVYRAERDT